MCGYTKNYIFAFLPGLFIIAHTDIHRRFLTSMGKAKGPFYCLILGTLPHYLWCYIFVIKYKLGNMGIGIAGAITNAIVYIL